jgi:hypothetical protein
MKPGRKLKTKQGEVGISTRAGKNSSKEVFRREVDKGR